MKKIAIKLFVIIVLFLTAEQVKSQKMKELFIDSIDNKLDISVWLSKAHGFIPLASIITEPAVGYGGNIGTMFIHKKPDDYKGPPAITYTGGFLTENGSWGAIAAHVNNWNNDKIRYLGVFGYVDVNLTYYPVIANELTVPIGFSLNGVPFIQKLTFRIKESNYFVGAKYSWFSNTASIKRQGIIPPIKERELKGTVAGLGIVTGYDSRDNIFTPNTGLKSEIILMHNDNYFGSDYKYSLLETYGIYYHQTTPRLVSGFKVNYSYIWGDAPFYTKPFVSMRGVPAMRYQDNQIMQLEIEERWHMKNRWSLVGFGGLAKAYPNINDWQKSETAWSAGGGIRYLLAKLFDMHGGLDIARGPEEWTFYFVIGSSWNRQ